ncbi:MAG: flagellar hook-associated protein FlgL [Methylobacter sp.]|uniref:flagellar hook-associated protein FlgL n=1 Tax=Methylobacter sp. TaxID=2051955 RepID=UPI0025D600BE|nr:flagellar hook-associated protein FlgL [Methylobacter sp.]MCK9619980.1 flagellar hook-associated protein FlgL [Methylobacter sp.]
MRISTAWSQQLSFNAMSSQQTKLAKLQQQLSSGLKISAPAEDPEAAARILDLDKSITKTEQYQSNIATTRGRLNLEESALEAANNIIFKAKDLTIQAKNDTLNSSDRLAIKYEVDQLLEELAGVANTQNANGEYIFSGDLATVPAFARNATTGEYAYQGGLQQRALQISTTRQVADGDLGFNVFEHINSSSPAADENGKRSVFNTLKALSDGLGASLNATAGVITGDRFLRYGLDYSAATVQFDLIANGGITAPIDLSGQQFAGVEDVVTEINSQLTAGGFSGAIQARSNGNKIEFASVATGATSSIQINNTSGTFLADAGFAAGQVKAGVGAQTFQAQLGDVLTDLDAALGSFLDARSSVGARLNALDNQESQNEKYVIDTKSMLSETQDLDYADALSRYQLQFTALQAAQQTFTKTKELSLFKYL